MMGENQQDFISLVLSRDRDRIVSRMMAGGIGPENLREAMFDCARQVTERKEFEAARILLRFLVDDSSGLDDAAVPLSMIGDLYCEEGRHAEARENYGRLPMTKENLEKCLFTFLPGMDADGLLAAAERIMSGANPMVSAALEETIRKFFARIAGQAHIQQAHVRRYEKNLHYLEKIDPRVIRRLKSLDGLPLQGFPAYYADYLLRVNNKIYIAPNGIWQHNRLRPPEQRLKRSDLLLEKHILVRCASLDAFVEFIDAESIESPEFFKYQCCVLVDFRLLPLFLTVVDLSCLQECDFVLKFVDEADPDAALTEMITSGEGYIPEVAVSMGEDDAGFVADRVEPVVRRLEDWINGETEALDRRLADLYPPEFTDSIPEKILHKNLRILIRTSRFTTYLQHCARDLLEGFRTLGYPAELEIEGEHQAFARRKDLLRRKMCDFRPDIVICICHLRYEDPWVPAAIPFITWIQDKLEAVSSGRYIDRLTRNDILLTQTFYDELTGQGYKDLIEFPVPVNETVFKRPPRRKDFLHDIAYVNHFPRVDVELTKDEAVNKSACKQVHAILQGVLHKSHSTMVTIEDYRHALRGFIDPDNNPGHVYQVIRDSIGNFICRTMVLDWLIDSGFSPAIYGRGWENDSRYGPFARGEVSHGGDLADVFNRTKINLHVHPYITTHQRVFEAIAAGGFLLVKYLDPAKDLTPLTKYLAEGEGYVFFHDRRDLAEKINHYLADDRLREEITVKGQEKVLDLYTYEKRTKMLMDVVYERFIR